MPVKKAGPSQRHSQSQASKDLTSINCFNLTSVNIVARWVSKSCKLASSLRFEKLPKIKSLKGCPLGSI